MQKDVKSHVFWNLKKKTLKNVKNVVLETTRSVFVL